MQVLLALALGLALLTGCTTPSPDFLGAARQDVVVDGMRFAVYRNATDAQVIRLDHVSRKARAQVPARMMQAAQRATGCTAIPDSLRPIGGPDSTVAQIALRCQP